MTGRVVADPLEVVHAKRGGANSEQVGIRTAWSASAPIFFFGSTSITGGLHISSLVSGRSPVWPLIGDLTFSVDFDTVLFPIGRPALFTGLEQVGTGEISHRS
jgi:hypothetical protein